MSKKMSGVFKLPVDSIDILMMSKHLDEKDCEIDYAAHAINSHDSLTEEVERLREALNKIKSWDSHTLKLSVDQGSNGVRDLYRQIAAKALEGGDE